MQTFKEFQAYLTHTRQKLLTYHQNFENQTMGIEELETALNALQIVDFERGSLSPEEQEILYECFQGLKQALGQLAQTIEAYKANLAAEVNTIKKAKRISKTYANLN